MEVRKIVNLTPHVINIIVGEKKIEIPTSGVIVRCEEETTVIGKISYPDADGRMASFPVISKKLGKCNEIPKTEDGTIYIASLPVAQKLERCDVLGIGESVRDAKGNIIGCKSFASFVK